MIKNARQATMVGQRINHLRTAKREIERLLRKILPCEDIDPRISSILEEVSSKLEADVHEFAQANKVHDHPLLISSKQMGKELIKVRILLGWSQSTLAEKSKTARNSIVSYERNEYKQTTLKRIQQIADVLIVGLKEMEEERLELRRLTARLSERTVFPCNFDQPVASEDQDLSLHQAAPFDNNWKPTQHAECSGDINHHHCDLGQDTICKP